MVPCDDAIDIDIRRVLRRGSEIKPCRPGPVPKERTSYGCAIWQGKPNEADLLAALVAASKVLGVELFQFEVQIDAAGDVLALAPPPRIVGAIG